MDGKNDSESMKPDDADALGSDAFPDDADDFFGAVALIGLQFGGPIIRNVFTFYIPCLLYTSRCV